MRSLTAGPVPVNGRDAKAQRSFSAFYGDLPAWVPPGSRGRN